MAIPVAVLTGACGAMFGLVLTSLGALPSQAVGPPARRAGGRLPSRAISIGLVVLTVLAIGSATANGLRYHVPQNVTATITLADVPAQGPGQRMVNADVRVNPLDFVSDNANWVSILGWQGRLENQRGEVVTNLEKLGPGHYRTEPVPVWGTWKTLLRLHDGETLAAVPIYLAGDPGIGAKDVPAEASMTRPFVAEITILQRERNPETPALLWTVGCLVVLVCTLVLIGGLSWGAGRINRSEASGSEAELQPTAQA
jgi:hypothetical protein